MKNVETKRTLKALVEETEGLSTVEYIILLVLIAIVGMAGWKAFGGKVRSTIDTSSGQVDTLNSTAGSAH